MRGGDCSRGDNAGERFVGGGMRAELISATGVRCGGVSSRFVRGAFSPTEVRRGGAKTMGDELPVVEAREGSRQMQHDAAHTEECTEAPKFKSCSRKVLT